MPILLHILQDQVIHKFNLKKEGKVTVGRKDDNDIKLDDLAVSGHHARLIIRQHQNRYLNALQEVVIEDLDSTNGTYINGKRVKAQSLEHDDIIKFGDHTFRFEDGPDQE